MEPVPCTISVLIAEDDKIAGATLAVMIPRKFPGVSCHLADNGRDGLAFCTSTPPDIVITDINMPEMDGIQMASEIQKIKADTRFIVISAYNEERYRQKFTEIGICQYLAKPIRFPKLFAAVEQSIAEVLLARTAREPAAVLPPHG